MPAISTVPTVPTVPRLPAPRPPAPRRSRRPVQLALAAALVLAGQLTGVAFALPCRDCGGLFIELRADIRNPALVPEPFQTSLENKAILAEIASPTDPCRALRHLDALTSEVTGLQTGLQLTLEAANILAADVEAAAEIIIPTDPC